VAKRHHIDHILRDWEYKPGMVMARRVKGADGRELIQMRVEMGVLQLEVAGRPDGEQPHGEDTYFNYLDKLARTQTDEFVLTEEQCDEVDREFVQYYHRRICWLALRDFRLAEADAKHTLQLMDFSSRFSPDEQWTLSHEQYRPFVMFHRIQASAVAELEDNGPEAAIEALNQGLADFEELYAKYEAEEELQDDELVARLTELRDSIREHYNVGRTLNEELAEAVAAEEYERAAKIRDQIARREPPDTRHI
jgi:hypothetical protein